MSYRLFIVPALVLAAHVHAAEAGKVIFTAGSVHIAEQAGAEGMAVQENALLRTGADGFLYIKTLDNGLFILRPNTEARIVAYHIDKVDPSNTRVKLELIKGVARSKSGEAVKQARQNFRFNTPVAAIGVRGTDFTVYTDQNVSRVAVLTGGVVVSGFADGCRPDGVGPCEGVGSRELSALQRGQLLQVQRGQAVPQLLQGGAGAPDLVSPPRADEPVAKSGTAGPAEPALDAQKSGSIAQVISQKPSQPAPPSQPGGPVVVIPPPVAPGTEVPSVPTVPVVPTVPTAPAVPLPPPRQLDWGRWTAVLDKAPQLTLATPEGAERILGGVFVLYMQPGRDFSAPAQGSIGFALRDSEAYVTTSTAKGVEVSAAQVSNGVLNVDFDKRSFATSLDLTSGNGLRQTLQATGEVGANGRLYGDASYSRIGLIDVQGALSDDKGGSAAYLFGGRLDDTRTVNGATSWGKQ